MAVLRAASPRPLTRARSAPFPICGARSTASSSAPASDPNSHSGKALVNVLENYPRDELFQIDEDTLYQFALAILQLDERPRVRVLPRCDRFDRFVSVLVYVPRERYDSRRYAARIGNYLGRRFQRPACSAFYPFFPEGPAGARPFHHRLATKARRRRSIAPSLDRAVEAIVRSWTDELEEALARRARPEAGARAARTLSRCLLGSTTARSDSAGDRHRRHPGRSKALTAESPARSRVLPPKPGWSLLAPV